MTQAKTRPDWERIESDFRAGLLFIREIAASQGVSHVAISKRAKKEGWGSSRSGIGLLSVAPNLARLSMVMTRMWRRMSSRVIEYIRTVPVTAGAGSLSRRFWPRWWVRTTEQSTILLQGGCINVQYMSYFAERMDNCGAKQKARNSVRALVFLVAHP